MRSTLNLSLSLLEADRLNYAASKGEIFFPGEEKEVIYSGYSQQYDREITYLPLRGFRPARSRGWEHTRIRIPGLAFLPLSVTPLSSLLANVGWSFWPPIQAPLWTLS